MTRSGRLRRWAAAALAAVFVAGCGGGGGGGGPATPPLSGEAGTVAAASLTSVHTGATYPLLIYLPASYDASPAKAYPVIYATDGDAGYPPEGRFFNFKRILQRRGTDAILVGISDTMRRNTDFILPGAQAYHAFLTRELVPFIEARYRADPQRRVLSGLSHGGAFVGIALLLDAPATPQFAVYLSAEGSFWQPSVQALEQQVADSIGSRPVPATLILASSGARFAASSNHDAVTAMGRTLRSRQYAGLQLIETSFDAGHVAMDNPSFEDALIRLFE